MAATEKDYMPATTPSTPTPAKPVLPRLWRVTVLAALAAAALLAFAGPASAATFTVDNLGDAPDDVAGDGFCETSSSVCTLRAAIEEANANDVEDAIEVDVPIPSGGQAVVQLTGALPNLTDDNAAGPDLTITGPGPLAFVVRRDTGGDYRIFTVESGAEVSMVGLQATNGRISTTSTPARGGAIHNSGDLTLTRVRVGASTAISTAARAEGGGIYSAGTGVQLTLDESTVIDNLAEGVGSGFDRPGGGGIYSDRTLTITGSTFVDNIVRGTGTSSNASFTSPAGGAILAQAGTIENSTVSRNFALSPDVAISPRGGGVYTDANVSLLSSTVTGNGASSGTGAGAQARPGENIAGNSAITGATVTLKNTIVSDSAEGGTNCHNITVNSLGHNLEDRDSCNLDEPTDLINTDPLLESLADNGGPTRSHAIPMSSPALDAGDNTANGFAFDQRGAGFDRTQDFSDEPNNPPPPSSGDDPSEGDGTDIGAFELQLLEGPPGDESCSDEIDNDGNGFTDQADENCQAPEGPPGNASCSDGIDNDGDSTTDQADVGCQSTEGPAGDATCSDGIDNDGRDGVDQGDPKCQSAEGPVGDASCSDGIDNDGDGATDAVDTDCQAPTGGGGDTGGGGSGGGGGAADSGSDTGAGDGSAPADDRVRPIFARPGVTARQARRGRARRVVKVVVTGRLVKTQRRRCSGRVAVGIRIGGKKARRTFQIQMSGKAPCTYRTVFRVKVRKLKKAVRSRRKRLLVRVNTNYKGSGLLEPDRAPSVLKRAIR